MAIKPENGQNMKIKSQESRNQEIRNWKILKSKITYFFCSSKQFYWVIQHDVDFAICSTLELWSLQGSGVRLRRTLILVCPR